MSGTWRTNSLTGVDGPVGHSRLFNLITLEPALVTADRETLEASRGRAGQILAAVILASVLLTDGGNPACREEREREREREKRDRRQHKKKNDAIQVNGSRRHTAYLPSPVGVGHLAKPLPYVFLINGKFSQR